MRACGCALAGELARLSEAVYVRSWARACDEFRKAGWRPIDHFDHAGAQAALVRRNDDYAAALVFRGTEASRLNVSDLWANVGVPRRWAGDGWAHSGYVGYLERIRYQARQLAEEVSSEVPLFATGHSKGGALATLYAAWVGADRTEGHNLAGLVTFGAPRVLSRKAAAAIDCPTWRFTIPLDFAPAWPFWPLNFWPLPVALAHPTPAFQLPSPTWWPGPISRHGVGQYVRALGGDGG